MVAAVNCLTALVRAASPTAAMDLAAAIAALASAPGPAPAPGGRPASPEPGSRTTVFGARASSFASYRTGAAGSTLSSPPPEGWAEPELATAIYDLADAARARLARKPPRRSISASVAPSTYASAQARLRLSHHPANHSTPRCSPSGRHRWRRPRRQSSGRPVTQPAGRRTWISTSNCGLRARRAMLGRAPPATPALVPLH